MPSPEYPFQAWFVAVATLPAISSVVENLELLLQERQRLDCGVYSLYFLRRLALGFDDFNINLEIAKHLRLVMPLEILKGSLFA